MDAEPTRNLKTIAPVEKIRVKMTKEAFAKATNRISFEEALTLYTETSIDILQRLADEQRQKLCGDTVFYSKTLYLYPTNICTLSCPMCSFYRKEGSSGCWFYSVEELLEQFKARYTEDLLEVHIVSGIHNKCTLDYYKALFQGIHAIAPHIHIKALTPVEYDFLAQLHHLSIEEVLLHMRSFGLGSIPGGGAEILVERIRKKIAPKKISSDRYLAIHRTAHTLKIPTNVTMLFGHIESPEDIIEHLLKIRTLQDETGGFKAFVPLKYHPEGNVLGKRPDKLLPKDLFRTYAISRIVLDNIPTIKVLWNYVGVEEAAELLRYGANDISATHEGEKVVTVAGGTKTTLDEERLCHIIRQANRTPCKVNSNYMSQHENRNS